jgi:MbtH protein
VIKFDNRATERNDRFATLSGLYKPRTFVIFCNPKKLALLPKFVYTRFEPGGWPGTVLRLAQIRTICLRDRLLSFQHIFKFQIQSMSIQNTQADVLYEVVTNDELQYSIWPADKALPLGWQAAGFKGVKQACLDHINTVWTDMRPLSLRQQMASSPE